MSGEPCKGLIDVLVDRDADVGGSGLEKRIRRLRPLLFLRAKSRARGAMSKLFNELVNRSSNANRRLEELDALLLLRRHALPKVFLE
jgi:hypothetical protein